MNIHVYVCVSASSCQILWFWIFYKWYREWWNTQCSFCWNNLYEIVKYIWIYMNVWLFRLFFVFGPFFSLLSLSFSLALFFILFGRSFCWKWTIFDSKLKSIRRWSKKRRHDCGSLFSVFRFYRRMVTTLPLILWRLLWKFYLMKSVDKPDTKTKLIALCQ